MTMVLKTWRHDNENWRRILWLIKICYYFASVNCFWTNQCHSTSCCIKWGHAMTNRCWCGKQTVRDIVSSCPQTRLEGGMQRLRSDDDVAVPWLMAYDLWTHAATTTMLYTVSKKNVPHLTCYNLYTHGSIVIIFGTRKLAIKMYFIFPPHLTSASALPGETRNPEIASFHLNAACFFTKKARNS